MTNNIIIIDYGMGNLHSVHKKLKRISVNAHISSNPKEILCADKIILPGVGHFQKAMANLVSLNLIETLNEAVIINKKPILGICLGMQLMAKNSEEGNTTGLGWFDAEVIRFKVSYRLNFKVPHTGWNTVSIKKESNLMKDIPDHSEFYFVHAYHFKSNHSGDVLNETEYDYTFPSAVEKDNIFGVQYHPEKSHDLGELVLRNFLNL